MVYASGTSTSISTGNITALSVGSNGNGDVSVTPTFASTEQRTQTSNLLAQAYAPPKLGEFRAAATNFDRAMGFSSLTFVALLAVNAVANYYKNEAISYLNYLGVPMLLIGIIWVVSAYRLMNALRGKDEESAAAFKAWQSQFLCFTCGKTFAEPQGQ